MEPTDKEAEVTPLPEVQHDDIVLSRSFGPKTNVPRTIIEHSPDGFEWGYGGSGPADLALNILNMLIPPGSDGQAPVKCHSGECSRRAYELHQDFKSTFIETMPKEGGTIAIADVRAYISEEEKWAKMKEEKDERDYG